VVVSTEIVDLVAVVISSIHLAAMDIGTQEVSFILYLFTHDVVMSCMYSYCCMLG